MEFSVACNIIDTCEMFNKYYGELLWEIIKVVYFTSIELCSFLSYIFASLYFSRKVRSFRG